MTIYTRMGSEIEIVEFAGLQVFLDSDTNEDLECELIRVRFNGEGSPKFRYKFAETLKATGGWDEIEMAIRQAGRITLSDAALDKAIQEAL